MAKGVRELVKRKMIGASKHLEGAQQDVMEAAEYYADEHPEIVEQLKVLYAFLAQGKVIIDQWMQTY